LIAYFPNFDSNHFWGKFGGFFLWKNLGHEYLDPILVFVKWVKNLSFQMTRRKNVSQKLVFWLFGHVYNLVSLVWETMDLSKIPEKWAKLGAISRD
jgi:hypothetical protein